VGTVFLEPFSKICPEIRPVSAKARPDVENRKMRSAVVS
jgi:hypothetical protein